MRRLFAALAALFAPVFAAPVVMAGELPARGGEEVTFLHILTYGWQINLVLCVLLFIAMFLVFHFLLATRRRHTVPGEVLRGVLDDVNNGDFERAIQRAQDNPSLLADAVLPGLRLHHHTSERVAAAMEGAGRRSLGSVRQEINFIAHVGTLSPMLGLLGTVLGLTKAFKAMGSDSTEVLRSAMMTGAIGEAMGTTVVGLIVGIPAMAAYFLCLSRFNRIADELEAATEDVSAAIVEAGGKNGGA